MSDMSRIFWQMKVGNKFIMKNMSNFLLQHIEKKKQQHHMKVLLSEMLSLEPRYTRCDSGSGMVKYLKT